MQAAVRATRDSGIPVVFVAVTDPVSAGVLATVDRPSGTHVTGVYNFDPVEAQMELARELRPGLKTLGVIYNAGESNSVANVKLLKAVTQKFGWSLVEATVTSTAEVRTAAQSLVGRTDAAYMPTDNTVMAGLEALLRVAQDAKLPLVTGDVSSVQRGALGAVGDDPEDKGRQAGALAARILRGDEAGRHQARDGPQAPPLPQSHHRPRHRDHPAGRARAAGGEGLRLAPVGARVRRHQRARAGAPLRLHGAGGAPLLPHARLPRPHGRGQLSLRRRGRRPPPGGGRQPGGGHPGRRAGGRGGGRRHRPHAHPASASTTSWPAS